MNKCPPPNGSLLPPNHQPFLAELFQTLIENEFRQSKLDPLVPGIIDKLSQLCATDDDVFAWCNEVNLWVRWYRLPAYWLTFILQLVTKARNSPFHVVACELHSDAQTLFADDLALSSLETAYVTYLTNEAALGPNFQPRGDHLRWKLRHYYDYYHRWSQPFEYVEANPCADHLYNCLSHSWLKDDVRELDNKLNIETADGLAEVVSRAQDEDLAFDGVLARRFLGLLLSRQGRYDLSIEQYEPALAEARRLGLDTEIGHLRRLLGWSLRAAGNGQESRHHLEQALAYERLGPVFAYTSYWQALSARELGDTIVRFAFTTDDSAPARPGETRLRIDDPEKLRDALLCYRDGRRHLHDHLSTQSPFPVARAAKQQLFRSFSANAILVASTLQSTNDMLAELEWSGPRQATELVTEIAAARNIGQMPLAEFRRVRAVYFKTLTTMPASFDEYLAILVQSNSDRRAYLSESLALDRTLIASQSCDNIVERALALRIPATLFLLFHVGTHASVMVLMDVSSGLAAPFSAPFGEDALRRIHEEFEQTVRRTEEENEHAIDRLMARYAELLGPLLEPLLLHLSGRHLKIFPRLQMNAVPLHALQISGKYLLDHCGTISYGQTLGLFLENHAAEPLGQSNALRVVIGEAVPLYDLILPKIKSIFAGSYAEERPASWTQLIASIVAQPAIDTLFACHGQYNPDNLDASYLRLVGRQDEGVAPFSRVFSELDLRGSRSVIMGACESGMSRTTIGAEYIGLPAAMLSSGVPYVIGASWKVPQLGTAVLMARFLELLKDPSIDFCSALCDSQRALKMMTREDLSGWIRARITPGAELDEALHEVGNMNELPFAHPYHWSGLQAVGDV